MRIKAYALNCFLCTVVIFLALGDRSAQAAAYANIDAVWSAQFAESGLGPPVFPTGFTFNCLGGASGIGTAGSPGCKDQETLTVSSAAGSTETFTETFSGGFSITNNSGSALGYGLNFNTVFSAFLPSGFGVKVEDPLTELASFTSSVSGPGAHDQHHCSTSATLAACGVPGADESEGFVFIPSLADGATYTASYTITITASLLGDADLAAADLLLAALAPDAAPVPEPGGLTLIGAGLLLVLGRSFRARRPRAASTSGWLRRCRHS